MKSKNVFFLFCFTMISCSLFSQVAEIPFELEDKGDVFMNVKVNDSDQVLNFIFDTGATSDLLDLNTANAMGLVPDHQQEVQGAGGSQYYDMVLSQNLHLENNIDITGTHLVLADLSSLNEVSPVKIDGIFGYSLLRKFITKIDYEHEKLVLYDKLKPNDIKNYSAIPFVFEDGVPIPRIDISITLKNGKTFTGPILFDSGAGLNLIVNSPFNKKNNIIEQAGKGLTSRSVNLNKESTSTEVGIQSLSIGDHNFDDLTILISQDEEGVSSWDGILGILGSQIIKRFNVILDYNSEIMYLKPNHCFPSEFEYPLSGVKLKKIDGQFFIAFLDESTSAYKMGLREGDQLISINDKTFEKKRDYYHLLKQEGEEVTLKVLNQSGEQVIFNLYLEKFLKD